MNQVSLFFFSTLACLALAENTEEEAWSFINKFITDDGKRRNDITVKEWAVNAATEAETEQAIKEYEEPNLKVAEYQIDIYKKIIKFPWKTFNDPKLKRLFFATMMFMQYDALPKDDYMKFVKLRGKINELKSEPKVKDMTDKDSPLLSPTDIVEKLKEGGLKDYELSYYWKEMHNVVGREAKQPFMDILELQNKAARENGYNDLSKLLQAVYEVDNFEDTMLKLYEDIKPLFQELHAYVRYKLWEAYDKNDKIIDPQGPIPASLLGSTWGADASPVFDQVAPFPKKPLLNLTEAIKKSGKTVHDIIESAKTFYTSLGLSPLPEDFWKNSIFERKKENMDCSASVYYFSTKQDTHYRLRLCAEPTEDGHTLLHSWIGYIYLLLATKDQPHIYKVFPNFAFDSAFQSVMVKFSMAPNYLTSLGVPNTNIQHDKDRAIKTLLYEAMENIFFLPFGLAWDQWRWRVAEGNITPEQFNCKYWDMRTHLQGVEPPVDRDENDFDPGARVRYIAGDEHIMYFIAEFLKLDMIRGLCKTAGYYDPKSKQKNPLVFCDVHGSKAVGDKIMEMMVPGASQPWYVALEKMTGTRTLDSSALLEYYEPLYAWLKTQNKKNGAKPGWTKSNKCHSEANPQQEEKVQ